MAWRSVVKLLCRSGIDARLSAFTMTAGHAATTDEIRTPKQRRLGFRISPALVQELLNFKLEDVPSGNDMVAEWRDGPHDDLVFAVTIAAWEER